MSNIDKQALREEFRNMQDHYSDPADRERQEIYIAAEAAVDELDSANGYASAYEAEKWHYHGLAESEGERAGSAEKRVAELESIATDYGVKFQKAQDALKHQALLHKSQMEAAERRIAELEARTVILPEPISVLHRRDFTDAHRAIYAYPEAEVNAALAAAGIKIKGE